jgi:hypothetical protein
MKYNEIKTIDENWLDEEIEKLSKLLNESGDDFYVSGRLDQLQEIKKSKLTSATPILKYCWDAAKTPFKINDYGTFGYENIGEFLNTEVNTNN